MKCPICNSTDYNVINNNFQCLHCNHSYAMPNNNHIENPITTNNLQLLFDNNYHQQYALKRSKRAFDKLPVFVFNEKHVVTDHKSNKINFNQPNNQLYNNIINTDMNNEKKIKTILGIDTQELDQRLKDHHTITKEPNYQKTTKPEVQPTRNANYTTEHKDDLWQKISNKTNKLLENEEYEKLLNIKIRARKSPNLSNYSRYKNHNYTTNHQIESANNSSTHTQTEQEKTTTSEYKNNRFFNKYKQQYSSKSDLFNYIRPQIVNLQANNTTKRTKDKLFNTHKSPTNTTGNLSTWTKASSKQMWSTNQHNKQSSLYHEYSDDDFLTNNDHQNSFNDYLTVNSSLKDIIPLLLKKLRYKKTIISIFVIVGLTVLFIQLDNMVYDQYQEEQILHQNEDNPFLNNLNADRLNNNSKMLDIDTDNQQIAFGEASNTNTDNQEQTLDNNQPKIDNENSSTTQQQEVYSIDIDNIISKTKIEEKIKLANKNQDNNNTTYTKYINDSIADFKTTVANFMNNISIDVNYVKWRNTDFLINVELHNKSYDNSYKIQSLLIIFVDIDGKEITRRIIKINKKINKGEIIQLNIINPNTPNLVANAHVKLETIDQIQ